MQNSDVIPPGKVVLFSGHMIDRPGREKPRFPVDKERIARSAISLTLDEIGVGCGDLCICGADPATETSPHTRGFSPREHCEEFVTSAHSISKTAAAHRDTRQPH
jgi:hypothetical protein